MSYVDIAVGIGLFLAFFAVVLVLSVQRFVSVPAASAMEEYRAKAISMFESLFSTGGTPTNWESTPLAPSELGLTTTIYKFPVTIEEPDISDRQNEPVIAKLEFDEECSNKTWNNTIRTYSSTLNETGFEFSNPVICSSQYLNESYVRFKVNISKGEKKIFYIYYSEDDGIPGPNYTMTYSTASWVPASGDSWTEAAELSNWYIYGGAGASPSTNSTFKMRGATSIQIKDTFSSASKLGITYNPASTISGVSNGWYLSAWLYVDDMSNLAAVNASISDGSETITANVTGDMTDGEWYHLERNLSSSQWAGWSSFNASKGIDSITFFMVNSSAGLTKQLKVDELHFGLRPLEVVAFPEETEKVVSRKKIDALNNLTYDELKEAIGEDYKFRIEITGG